MSQDTKNSTDALSPPGGEVALLKCGDIEALLFAYMTHELGDVQSRVVREHLRGCAGCRRVAAEIQDTMDMLRAGDAVITTTPCLTEERRKRILRAVLHPVMDWIDRHHRLVSVLIALLTLAIVLLLLRHVAMFRAQQLDDGIPIWRMFKSGKLPELVNEAHPDSLAPAKE